MEDEINSRFILFSPWGFLFLLLILILGNLFIIDTALFWNSSSTNENSSVAVTPAPKKISGIAPTPSECNESCKNEIKKEVALVLSQTKLTGKSTATAVKESFVTLGSGSSLASEWADIPGAQSYIDSTAYGTISKVTFEVALHTPTGNQTAYARLYNVTDAHPVWNSEVSIEGGTPQLKISSPITLDRGSKLYQVQMKTQLSSRTNLENARVHIKAN